METRPVYRVAAAGLDPRDVRLIEIVFKHSQYNRFEFRFEPRLDPQTVDILIVNPLESEGLRAVAKVRSAGRQTPAISAVPRGAPSSARHAISIDRLTLQLLPILNRVVELELLGARQRAGAESDAAAQAGAAGDAGTAGTAGTATGSAAAGAAGGAAAAQATAAAPSARSAGAPGHEISTRDFLREAARKSREGDTARDAAMRARGASAPAPDFPPAPGPGAPPSTLASSPRPAGASGAPTNLVAFPGSAEPMSPRIRVLVVDDSPTVRHQLSIAFGRMNVICDVAASAAEALQRLAVQHYDLVLVDVVMPEMDGYKLTRQIRRRHRGTPVIILTSRSSPFDLARGALAGCNSYLVKPVPLRQLEGAVVKQLRKSLAIDEISSMIRLTPDPRAPQRTRNDAPSGDRGANGRRDDGAPVPNSGGR